MYIMSIFPILVDLGSAPKENWAKLKTPQVLSLSKKCKVDSRILQEKWADEYYCVYTNKKVLCLICSESIDVFKKCSISRHCNSEKRKSKCI
jgi:hypothetical protein